MTERRIKRGLAVLLALCLAIPLAIAFADEDAEEMDAYWRIVGKNAPDTPLARAMSGETSPLEELIAVTPDDLLAFAAEYQLPIAMARYAYYDAIANSLSADIALKASVDEPWATLSLFLEMKNDRRNSAANQERRAIRKSLTEADINSYAAETGLPAGFLAWLLLDDEWYEVDWEDGDDWREGRRDWDFADWVDVSDMKAVYGKDAVVTEDDVERVLRKNGYRLDD